MKGSSPRAAYNLIKRNGDGALTDLKRRGPQRKTMFLALLIPVAPSQKLKPWQIWKYSINRIDHVDVQTGIQ